MMHISLLETDLSVANLPSFKLPSSRFELRPGGQSPCLKEARVGRGSDVGAVCVICGRGGVRSAPATGMKRI